MLTAVLVGFHANHDDDDPATWATPGRVQSMVVERGLASVRRLDDLIARFHATGYVARDENPADRRSRILRPTELLLAHDRAYNAVFHRFLHTLYPDRGYDWVVTGDPRPHLAFRKVAFRSQPIAAVMLRHKVMSMLLPYDAGFIALLVALQAGLNGDEGALSFSAIARRLGVSHTHVRNMFVAAEAAGYVTLGGSIGSIRILPRTWSEYDLLVADVESAHDQVAQQAFAKAVS
jgi:hypothetical protein